jgi:FtsZ-interacting cell division protein ZipA
MRRCVIICLIVQSLWSMRSETTKMRRQERRKRRRRDGFV